MIEWEPEIGSTDPLKSSPRSCQTHTSSTLLPDFEAEFKAQFNTEVKILEREENERRCRIWFWVKECFLTA